MIAIIFLSSNFQTALFDRQGSVLPLCLSKQSTSSSPFILCFNFLTDNDNDRLDASTGHVLQHETFNSLTFDMTAGNETY